MLRQRVLVGDDAIKTRPPARKSCVAADDAPQPYTPVALAVPTDVAIHFDIDWD